MTFFGLWSTASFWFCCWQCKTRSSMNIPPPSHLFSGKVRDHRKRARSSGLCFALSLEQAWIHQDILVQNSLVGPTFKLHSFYVFSSMVLFLFSAKLCLLPESVLCADIRPYSLRIRTFHQVSPKVWPSSQFYWEASFPRSNLICSFPGQNPKIRTIRYINEILRPQLKPSNQKRKCLEFAADLLSYASSYFRSYFSGCLAIPVPTSVSALQSYPEWCSAASSKSQGHAASDRLFPLYAWNQHDYPSWCRKISADALHGQVHCWLSTLPFAKFILWLFRLQTLSAHKNPFTNNAE